MSQTQTVIQRGDPAVEKFRLALIQDAKDAAAAGINTPLPAYQIAGLGQAELAALAAAQSSQGQFVPFLNQGSGAITAGQGLISQQGRASPTAGFANNAGRATVFESSGAVGRRHPQPAVSVPSRRESRPRSSRAAWYGHWPARYWPNKPSYPARSKCSPRRHAKPVWFCGSSLATRAGCV
jgi:hypothetical protein